MSKNGCPGGETPDLSAIPEPVFQAIARLETAAANHDADAIGAALQSLVDHYAADIDTPALYAAPYDPPTGEGLRGPVDYGDTDAVEAALTLTGEYVGGRIDREDVAHSFVEVYASGGTATVAVELKADGSGGGVGVDLTPAQARRLATMLVEAAVELEAQDRR